MIDMIFFSSPIGLGHASRDVAVVNTFQNISSVFVTGSNATKFFNKYNFDVEDVYTPPNFQVQKGLLKSPLKWLWKYYKYYKECKIISSDIIEKYNPKIIVSDEDFASLSNAQQKGIPNVLITDILETRFARGFGRLIEKKMNQSMQDIIKKCDLVILPEIGPDEGNIKRVGPIVRKTESNRNQLREKFGFEGKTILISIGGTDAGIFLIEKILKILPKLEKDVTVVVAGPALQKDFKGVKNLGFIKNLHEVIFASDVVVSLAGKSTIDETKAYGTPGIFIPIKDHFEQEDNAKEEGFSYDDLENLESLISEKLSQKRSPAQVDGAQKANILLKEVLSQI